LQALQGKITIFRICLGLTRNTPNKSKPGVAVSDEERTEGVCAFAVPVPIYRTKEPIAMWIVGLKTQIDREGFPFYMNYLKAIAKRIKADLQG